MCEVSLSNVLNCSGRLYVCEECMVEGTCIIKKNLPPKRGQHGDKPFVLSREVIPFWRFLFLSLKMKHSSCLDTNTTNKRECNQLNHESVDVSSFCKRLP